MKGIHWMTLIGGQRTKICTRSVWKGLNLLRLKQQRCRHWQWISQSGYTVYGTDTHIMETRHLEYTSGGLCVKTYGTWSTSTEVGASHSCHAKTSYNHYSAAFTDSEGTNAFLQVYGKLHIPGSFNSARILPFVRSVEKLNLAVPTTFRTRHVQHGSKYWV